MARVGLVVVMFLLVTLLTGPLAGARASSEPGGSGTREAGAAVATADEVGGRAGGMDGNALWSLLRLAGASVAICLSILLWYVRHFLETLRNAEEDSPAARQAIEQSPRIFGIIAGVAFTILSAVLASFLLADAFARGAITLPLWSSGFWLLIICVLGPAFGAAIVGIVAIAHIGWFRGLRDAFVCSLSGLTRWRRPPVVLAFTPAIPLDGRSQQAFSVSMETAAVWRVSLRWVKANEARWGLGRGFLTSNKNALVSIVDHCWRRKQELGGNATEPDDALEQEVAGHLQASLTDSQNLNARILNRPSQLARAACALYAKTSCSANK